MLLYGFLAGSSIAMDALQRLRAEQNPEKSEGEGEESLSGIGFAFDPERHRPDLDKHLPYRLSQRRVGIADERVGDKWVQPRKLRLELRGAAKAR